MVAQTHTFPIQLAKAPVSKAFIDVRSPYSGEIIGKVAEATEEIIDLAFATAVSAQRETLPNLPAYRRAEILNRTADLVERNLEDYAMTIALEGGKPLTDARAEVVRAVNTLHLSAEVAVSLDGEAPFMGRTSAGDKKTSFVIREPIGIVSGISAFNHPLNLSAHIIGPAFAAGNAVVLKPAPVTPLCSMKLGQHFLESGMPPDVVSIVNCDVPLAEKCATDPRIAFLNFIGSEHVGWSLRAKLPPGARLMLEHGGTAPAIVEPSADLEHAASACLKGGYYHAGQVCVSLQRLYVNEDIYSDFMQKFVSGVRNLNVGDPTKPDTQVGPIIRKSALDRIDQWVKEAITQGAKLATGGEILDNNCYAPTVLENVTESMKVYSHEIFGPVVAVMPYADLDSALALANDSPYAFQSSIFTRDIERALHAAKKLDSTGVMINDHPAFRVDWMPFGGRKRSGIGMGGVRYAAEEMSQLKIINIHTP